METLLESNNLCFKLAKHYSEIRNMVKPVRYSQKKIFQPKYSRMENINNSLDLYKQINKNKTKVEQNEIIPKINFLYKARCLIPQVL